MNFILGLGTDIIEIARIKEAILRHSDRFIERVFTEKEREYCSRFEDPYPHFAGRFSAKEAVFKAFGTGLQKEHHWHDVEIVLDRLGKPEVVLSKQLEKSNQYVLVSISHCKEYATATAIIWNTKN